MSARNIIIALSAIGLIMAAALGAIATAAHGFTPIITMGWAAVAIAAIITAIAATRIRR